jgi:GNAT superfamily N-acetyltransferase
VRPIRQSHTNPPASLIAWGLFALGEYKTGAVHPEGRQALDGDVAARLEVGERRPDDDDAALALRNQVFPPIEREHWVQSQTAAVARLDGRLVGVVPFAIRSFTLAAGVEIRAAFANSVAVADDLRGLGIGTRMMDAARQFLPARAEAMCVYTGNEAAGPQYRFYRRSGYHDLLYPRRMTMPVVDQARVAPAGVALVSIDEISTAEADLLEVYLACYACWGGSPVRELGYWRRALASQIFVEIPYEMFDLILARDGGQLAAYAIAGTRDKETVVLEAAARDAAAAAPLWEGAAALAALRESHRISIPGPDFGTPLHDSLLRAGFRAQPRDDVLSGHVVAPESVYAASLRAAGSENQLAFEVWTPEQTVRLGSGEPSLRLEMKEEDLHRLLLRRLDLDSAIREQRITVRTGDWDSIRRVASTLTPAPWVYHHLDYI